MANPFWLHLGGGFVSNAPHLPTVSPKELAKPFVHTYPSYVAGRPIEDVARDLGLDPSGIIKLASNENPFGPSPLAVEAAKRALE